MDDAAVRFEIEAAPDNSGHRGRLRERALKGGVEALPDYELMELLLFRCIARRDTKPLAKKLLERFGSLSAALSAPVAALLQVRTVDAAGRRLALTPESALDLRAGLRRSRAPHPGSNRWRSAASSRRGRRCRPMCG